MIAGGPDHSPGLSGTHNQMEGDASPTRNDAYTNSGDASTLSMDYFKHLYNSVPGKAQEVLIQSLYSHKTRTEGKDSNFNMEVMAKQRAWTREKSIST
jgi:hypothetical protein